VARRAIAAMSAAFMALVLVVSPVAADTEYAGVQSQIDWRFVAIYVLVGLFAFAASLNLANRGR